MKSFTKKILVLVTLLCVALGAAVFTACDGGGGETEDGGTPNAYTVTVKDESGAPFTGVDVQFCEIGEGAFCYSLMYPTDANGKVVVNVSALKAQTDGAVGESLAVHIFGVANYYSYDEITVKRGGVAEIVLREHKPSGGTGFGEFDPAKSDNSLVYSTFSPYEVEEGYYRVNVSEAGKWVYFSFRGSKNTPSTYRITSTAENGIDPAVRVVTGSPASGYWLAPEGNETLGQDNRSETDKNFRFLFHVDQGTLDQSEGRFVLAITVNDEASAGKDFTVQFAYTGEYTSPESQLVRETVTAEQILSASDPRIDEDGKFIGRDTDYSTNRVRVAAEDAKYALNGADHLYHLSSDGTTPDGALLVVSFAAEHGCRDIDTSFYKMHVDESIGGEEFAFYSEDRTTRYSYGTSVAGGKDFIESYGEACNADGMYPLTEELKLFLDRYTASSDFTGYLSGLDDNPLSDYEEENYFLYFCFVYPEGTAESPYTASATEYDASGAATKTATVKVTEEGACTLQLYGAGAELTYTVVLQTEGAELVYDGHTYTKGETVTITVPVRTDVTFTVALKQEGSNIAGKVAYTIERA